ncbi:MAG: hypothetical protein WC789_08930 [Lentisphaeria bacterium]|jgi:hypothetical protein
MPLFPEPQLELVRHGDLATIAALDARGLPPGPGETAAAFAERLATLGRNLDRLAADLAANGTITLAGLTLAAADRIDPTLYAEAAEETERLFAFQSDWVPGFYVNPRFAWLFGGCAYFDTHDFFALFIIRKAFARQPRWFLYNRRELLAHELTHVARIALNAERFEERFAYQTAETAFRRALGSVFRTPADSALLLGAVLILAGSRLLQALLLPNLVAWPFWLAVFGVACHLGFRHWLTGREFQRARNHLIPTFGERALAALCRCTDAEIRALAALRTPQTVAAWLAAKRAGGELRWQLLFHRFAQPEAEAAAPPPDAPPPT